MFIESLILAWKLLPAGLANTLYMVGVAAVCAVAIGLPIGVLLTVTGKGHLYERLTLHRFLGVLVNSGRSVPFAILMVALIPLTRLIVGTSLGTVASIVPLTVAAIPFVARVIEKSLQEVDPHVVEAVLVMGSTPWQIITKVLLVEALPSIISGITLTVVNLIGYSAMAGLVGGGGLGQVAIQYGYHRFDTVIMVATIALLVLVVQGVQGLGSAWAQGILNQRRKGK